MDEYWNRILQESNIDKAVLLNDLFDMRDAAEFEARVAARLAERDDSYQRCGKCPSKFKGVSCNHDAKACRLLWARIVVEEEMDG